MKYIRKYQNTLFVTGYRHDIRARPLLCRWKAQKGN